MEIELIGQNDDIPNKPKNYHKKCILDTSTLKGKILFGLTFLSAILVVTGVIIGLAIVFAIL